MPPLLDVSSDAISANADGSSRSLASCSRRVCRGCCCSCSDGGRRRGGGCRCFSRCSCSCRCSCRCSRCCCCPVPSLPAVMRRFRMLCGMDRAAALMQRFAQRMRSASIWCRSRLSRIAISAAALTVSACPVRPIAARRLTRHPEAYLTIVASECSSNRSISEHTPPSIATYAAHVGSFSRFCSVPIARRRTSSSASTRRHATSESAPCVHCSNSRLVAAAPASTALQQRFPSTARVSCTVSRALSCCLSSDTRRATPPPARNACPTAIPAGPCACCSIMSSRASRISGACTDG